MNRIVFVLILFLLCSCAVQYKPIANIRDWPFSHVQFDSAFSLSYADDILGLTGNKRADRWAHRKGIQVVAVKIINNGSKPVHGTQLHFVADSLPVEVLQNEWLARKIRQRRSPLMILAIPAMIVEASLWGDSDDDPAIVASNYEIPSVTAHMVESEEKTRKKANFNLGEELKKFQVNRMIYWPGKPVFGIVGLKTGNSLKTLQLKTSEVDFQIVKANL